MKSSDIQSFFMKSATTLKSDSHSQEPFATATFEGGLHRGTGRDGMRKTILNYGLMKEENAHFRE